MSAVCDPVVVSESYNRSPEAVFSMLYTCAHA